uniref:Tetrahydrofolate dehydrogenase/cyclohydrolase n=1 Tax=Marseillevirus LCMAC201 TaxID=2506605 RepID=A0A481YVW6_9VIRU|nr:MAG: tetrahydrofolate dehydrogenase/cyclohydrolase [Marseillevirus LCMAC201]
MNGKKVGLEIEELIKEALGTRSSAGVPGLAIVQIGNDSASQVYTSMKAKACQRVGFHSENHHLSDETQQEEVLNLIEELNNNEKIHGILVQLPLPNNFDEEKILQAVSPEKDVDGFNSLNTSRLMSRNRPDPYFIPATPFGIIHLLHEYNIPIAGQHAVIVGHSNIVGMPIAHALLQEWATITICHVKTNNVQEICRSADILISATGKPGLITPDFVKPGATVIDVGITRDDTGKIVGDVSPDVKQVAGALTSVPGGVGPMTIASLLANTFKSFAGVTVFDLKK